MKKGFTLVELIGVIALLAIIALITVPSITSVINKSKKQTDETQKREIIKAATQCVLDNEGRTINCQNVQKLINDGYLGEQTKKTKYTSVIITIDANNNYTYKVK